MNNKFLKQLVTIITSLTKAKSLALRTKASTFKKGAVLFSLIRNKRFLAATFSQRLHDLLPSSTRHEKEEEEDDDGSGFCEKDKTVALYTRCEYRKEGDVHDEEEEGEKYPELRHGLFGEEDDGDFEDPGGSVVDIVKGTKGEGEEFNLEDEIDRVADLFIRRFHRQMRMQKQLSLKRVHDMLQRSL